MLRSVAALAALLAFAPAAHAQSAPAAAPAARAATASPKLVGQWAGTVKVGQNDIDVVLNIASSDAGMQLYMDIPSQNIVGMQVTDTRIAGTSISFPGGNGRYEGTVNAAGTTISGKYIAGGTETPLNFQRRSATPTLPAILSGSAEDPAGLAGDFTGTLQAGPGLEGSIHLRRLAEGYAATLDVPVQQALGIPATTATVEGDQLTAVFPFGTFAGTFSPDRTTLTGTWTQNGQTFPFNLTRD